MSTANTTTSREIEHISIEEEMRRSYLDYAMSVIVSRALPDVRDGMKPVHRRILYSMKEGGFEHNKPFNKSARIVGLVMGRYHPHGNAPIYEAMVRLAQNFSMSIPLIEGHGNFGSMDGDPPAAERYTEARLAKVSQAILDDIDKDTVDFQPNYDNSTVEPIVLPARFPNVLVNGAGGIAVGMATNIPTHNLGEVIDACCAVLSNPLITLPEIMQLVPGPDFPTSGLIIGQAGIRSAYETGRGSIIMRGRTAIEQIRKDKEAIIITEIPYQVNKARLVERIAELVQQKVIEGISDLRDESDRRGVRVVIELKRDAMANVILNLLYKHTPLQTTFGANIVALNKGQPRTMNLLDIFHAFIAFRSEVITRRTRFELRKAREKSHILVGLAIAVANIDAMIALIRKAKDPQTAKEQMMACAWPLADVGPLITMAEPGFDLSHGTYQLSEQQAKGILELRLHRLTGLERDKISKDLQEQVELMKDLLDILNSRQRLQSVMRQEFLEVKEKYATPRRTEIMQLEEGLDIDEEDFIQKEDMVITVSHAGYIKRVPLNTYRAQKRGGKGRIGMTFREEDFICKMFVTDTHTPVLFFSTAGKVYVLKVYRLPIGTPQSRGKALVNLLPLAQDETISTIMLLPEDKSTWNNLHVMFATSMGTVRRNALSDFTNVQSNGKIAMKLGEGEHLISVASCHENQDMILTTKYGKCIRFAVTAVREFASRTSTGVRGIKLAKKDEIISMSVLEAVDCTSEERESYLKMVAQMRRSGDEDESNESSSSVPPLSPERFSELAQQEQFLLTVTSRGYGKRTSAYAYRVTARGGQGIANIELTTKNGHVVSAFPVSHQDQVMLVTNAGKVIRSGVEDVRIAGRRTQGVTVLRVDKGEEVVSVDRLAETENGEDSESENTEE